MVNKSFGSFVSNKDLTNFLSVLHKEWNRQDNKFPNRIHSLEKWIIIIGEEFGEICKEAIEIKSNDYNFEKLYKEIIQTITLLIRLRYSVYTINLSDKSIII